VIVFALLTAPVSRPGICSFLFFIVIVDQFSVVITYELPERRVFSTSTALNISLSVGTAVNIKNSFGSINFTAFTLSVSFILAGHSANYNIYSPP
jgi:hypothetical protein